MLGKLSLCVLLLNACASTANEPTAFEQVNNAAWQRVMFDAGDKDWQKHWLVDGLVGTVENTSKGMHIKAGPEAKNHAHHIVLWTKQSFSGDIKVEFEFTRTDEASRYVSILYLFATGEQTPGFEKDIMDWADYRNEPYMRHYFDNMNAYHISYAAFGPGRPDDPKDYIRARRYLPLANKGLADTALEGDNFNTGFFETGVPHKIIVIRKGGDLWMQVTTAAQSQTYHWTTTSHPEITEGRIGLRHMFTRTAVYKNFAVYNLPKQ